MAEGAVGSPDTQSGGSSGSAPSSATAATFKVNDQSLKALNLTWAEMVVNLKAVNAELSKIGDNSGGLDKLQALVGGGKSGGQPGGGSGGNRMEGMPSAPAPVGGGGGSGPTSSGGGGGADHGGGGASLKKAGLGAGAVAAGVSGYYQTRMQQISDADLFFNQQAQSMGGSGGYQGSNKNLARQQIFNKNSGISGYQSVGDALGGAQTTLGAVGGNLSPGGRGVQALQGASVLAGLNPAGGFQAAGNASAELYAPQTSMRAQMMGFGPTIGSGGALTDQSQVFQNILNKEYGGKKVTTNMITQGMAPGSNLSASLGQQGLNLGPDSQAAFQQYGLAYANLGNDPKQARAAAEAASKKMNGQKTTPAEDALIKKSGLTDSIRANQNKMGSASARGTVTAGEAGTTALEAGFTALSNVTQSLTDAFQGLNSSLGGALGGVGGLLGSTGTPIGSAVHGLGGIGGAAYAYSMLSGGHPGQGGAGHLGQGGSGGGGLLSKIKGKIGMGGGLSGSGTGGFTGSGGGGGGGLGTLNALSALDATPVYVVNMGMGGIGGGFGGGGGIGVGGGGGGGGTGKGGSAGAGGTFVGAGGGAGSGAQSTDPVRGSTSALSRAGNFVKNNAGNAALGLGAGLAVNQMTSGLQTNSDGTKNQAGTMLSHAATAATTVGMMTKNPVAAGVAAVGAYTVDAFTPQPTDATAVPVDPSSAPKPRTGPPSIFSARYWQDVVDPGAALKDYRQGQQDTTTLKQSVFDQFNSLLDQWNTQGYNSIPEAKAYYDKSVAPFEKKKNINDHDNSVRGINALTSGLSKYKGQVTAKYEQTGITPSAPHRAIGGDVPVVPGNHPHDNVVVHAKPGELIVPTNTVAKHGGASQLMRQLGFKGRNSASGHYADGGAPAPAPAPNVDAGVAFAKSKSGEPYVWGATGPGSYDCSGFAGSIWAAMNSKPTEQRYFTTDTFIADFAKYGFAPGLGGRVEIGASHEHMATTIDGVNAEAGGNGVLYGGKAAGAGDGQFPNKYHMTGVGGGPDATGAAASPSTATTGAGSTGAPGGASTASAGSPGILADEKSALAGATSSPGFSGSAGAPYKAPDLTTTTAPGAAAGGGAGATADPGGTGSERWRSLVDTVLGELKLDKGLDNKVVAQIQSESSGDPNSIDTWDSNAQAGHPSKGLMQVILSTFNDNAGPYVSLGQLDPKASIYAGVNYESKKNGGNPTLSDFGQGHGYAKGAWELPADETANVHQGEMVVPKGPATIIRNAMRDSSRNAQQGSTATSITATGSNGTTVTINMGGVSLGGSATQKDANDLVRMITTQLESDKVLSALGSGAKN